MFSTLSVYTYELPLNTHFSFKAKTRQGIIVESPEHHVFVEAAPLPGYSKESLQEALNQISSILDPLLRLSNDVHPEESLASFLKETPLFPSVSFAFYSLFKQIYSPIKKEILAHFRAYCDVSYAHSTFLEQLQKLSTGTQTVKVKLGSYPVNEAIKLMEQALNFSSKTSFHLDINQKWSLKDALTFCNYFPKESFVCIEDPVQDVKSLWLFAQNSCHPIALDHLLRTSSFEEVMDLPHLYSCEFKPTLDMPLLLNNPLLSSLRKKNILITLSSAYETSIGIAAISRLGLNSPCLGVDTLGIFKEDLLTVPLKRYPDHFVIPSALSVNKKQLDLYASLSYC